MSPPPRLEAQDYWNSRSSQGGKKKQHTRGTSALRDSQVGQDEQTLHSAKVAGQRNSSFPETTPRVGAKDRVESLPNTEPLLLATTLIQSEQEPSSPPIAAITSLKSHLEHEGNEGPLMNASQDESSESPAVTSLKRLSVAMEQNTVDSSPGIEKTRLSIGSLVTSLLASSSSESSTQERPIEDPTISRSFARRRSSAFRDGDKRRLKKDGVKGPLSGLEIPAVITLRKATGLFQVGTAVEPPLNTSADEAGGPRESPSSSPTTFTLVGFDSKHLGGQEQTAELHEEARTRKASTVSSLGHELLLPSITSSKNSELVGGRRQSIAEPAITITKIFPSPAIIASPATDSSPVNDSERRISVVQIMTRNSLHQVIWREDDTSSGSGSSSDHISPTVSIKLPETSENSPVKNSATTSNSPSAQSSKITLSKDEGFAPNSLGKDKAETSVDPLVPRPQGQILQWSWGEAARPSNLTNSNMSGRGPWGVDYTEDRLSNNALPTGQVLIPELQIPEDEGLTRTPHELGIARRGSFMVDSPSVTNLTAGRELGSRRSICVQPLTLANLAELGTFDSEDHGGMNRRLSRVDLEC